MNMKRILSVLLVLTMVIPMCLTGCQKEADDLKETSIRQNVTLNMYIVTEEETDPEQAKAVQMALNEILLPDYKTTVKINYLTSDVYWDEIDKMEADTIAYQEQLEAEAEAAKKAAQEANMNKGKNDNKKTEEDEAEDLEAEVEEEYNELVDQVFEQDDIVIENPQIDIFLVNSPEKYSELIKDERLAPLDSYITLENKVIKSYIYPTFLAGAKLGGNVTYGIPVNKVIGEYEYFVFNKELLDKYGFKAEDMKTFDSLGQYLAVIAANEPGVVPLAHSAAPQFYEYYGEEGNALGLTSNQIIASAFDENNDPEVKNHFRTVRSYKLAGYIPDNYVEGTKFAVDIRKGYADSPSKWSEQDGTEYVCEIYKRPLATNNNTLDSVFVVSAQSRNPQRAAEIIAHLTTEPELVNILQYGIEGTHYYLNSETGKVKINPNGGYYMNSNYTGNEYIKYVLDGEENRVEAYKQQNIDSLVSLYYCYVPTLTLTDELVLARANEIAQRYYPGLVAGIYDVDSVFAEINAQLLAIDVTSEINAMLAENPELPNERMIYSYDETPGVEPEEEAEEVEEPAVSEENTDAENADTETETDEPEIEIPEREAGSEAGQTPFDQMVFNVDDMFYEFICTPGAASILALQADTIQYYNIENQNVVETKEAENELKELVSADEDESDEPEGEIVGEVVDGVVIPFATTEAVTE